ncbi:uncharacterized protein LOC119163092 isoform X1 [Rhipicephalus microplus]|uniref:uncharacterized protein LOC119163092 isoform X1 n=1 Tax=Rhipicephalus microplus TaxID=6941 RepID=UPI003F6D4260
MQEVSGSFMKPSRNRIHWTLLGMNLECLCIGTIQLHDCYEFHNVMLTRPCSLTLAFDGFPVLGIRGAVHFARVREKRKAFLPAVQLHDQKKGEHGKTPSQAHGQASILMPAVFSRIQSNGSSHGAFAHPHWRAALLLHTLPCILFKEDAPKRPLANPYGTAPFCL